MGWGRRQHPQLSATGPRASRSISVASVSSTRKDASCPTALHLTLHRSQEPPATRLHGCPSPSAPAVIPPLPAYPCPHSGPVSPTSAACPGQRPSALGDTARRRGQDPAELSLPPTWARSGCQASAVGLIPAEKKKDTQGSDTAMGQGQVRPRAPSSKPRPQWGSSSGPSALSFLGNKAAWDTVLIQILNFLFR